MEILTHPSYFKNNLELSELSNSDSRIGLCISNNTLPTFLPSPKELSDHTIQVSVAQQQSRVRAHQFRAFNIEIQKG